MLAQHIDPQCHNRVDSKSPFSSSPLGCDHLYSATRLTVLNKDKIRNILSENFLLELEKVKMFNYCALLPEFLNTLGDKKLFLKEECIIILIL